MPTKKDMTLFEQVEQIRIHIDQQQDAKETLEEALVSREEAQQRLSDWVDHQGSKSNLTHLLTRFTTAKPYPTDDKMLGVPVSGIAGSNGYFGVQGDAAPILCAIFGDELKDRLSVLMTGPDYEGGPPLAERSAMINAIQAKLDELELEEERLIVEAESQHIHIARREDVRPEVILALPKEKAA